jgi:branched-chain amino acid transport system substrate-binding protein
VVSRLFARGALAALLGLALGSAPPARAQVPYEINVILPLTGNAAFLGSKEAESFGVMEKLVNRTGGIRGRPIRFAIGDDASDPKTSVQLTARLIEQKVPVILGSSVSSMCAAMGPLVQKNGPLTYCLSPIAEPPAGSFEFTAAIGSTQFMPLLPEFARARGWTRLALLMSIDTTGQDYETKLDAALKAPEAAGISIVAREHFQNNDISVAAQVAKIAASHPDVVITTATGPPFGSILRSLKDAGIDLPVIGPGSNMTYAQLTEFAAVLPKTIYFISMAGAKADPAARGPWRTAQSAFFDAFKLAGIRPEYGHLLAWDPGMIVIDALRKLGPDASAQQLHEELEQLHDWYGDAGRYDFRAYPQRGLGVGAADVYEWITAKHDYFVVAHGSDRRR